MNDFIVSTLLFSPLCAYPPTQYAYLCILFRKCFNVYFKNKCKAINMSDHSVAAGFPEITGIAQPIFLHVQVYKNKVAMRSCNA